MRDLDDALKDLSDFESLVRDGLHPSKSLEKVEHENEWDSFNFARIEFRVGQLTVEANAHSSCSNGRLNVWVWNFNNPPSDVCSFDMGGNAEHVARVVVDYINEHEGSSMTDAETLDRVYMTLGGLHADAKGMNNHMRAGIEYATGRMEAALIEALQSNKY